MIRICLIGCGSIAFAAHGPALSRLQSEGIAELIACCDMDTAKAESFRQKFGFTRAYSDYEMMLDTEKPNAVFTLLPVWYNAACAIRTLELGYPVIMEKPPGVSAREARAIAAAAQDHNLYHAVLFNRRSMPLVQLLKEKLAEERVVAVSLEMCREGRSEKDFTTTAIHGIDCLRHLFGDFRKLSLDYEVDTVRGNVDYFAHGSLESGAHVDMRFLPCAGAVTERISVYTTGKQFYLNLPVWSGTTYLRGFDFPGSLVCAEKECETMRIMGSELSNSEDGFVLNGFYEEDKRIIKAIEGGELTVFPVSAFLQSVEISYALRNRQPHYARGEQGK